ncbi:MAG TPA: DNA-3-methyladenine glycosylase, partial [Gemmatimonadales bacterium]|nr:DNA-3-methyladenine glycosylase [Gemmatimonadales bacterium]
AQALGITDALDGRAARREAGLWVAEGMPVGAAQVVRTPRIGLTRAADWPLRFAEAGTRWASRPPGGQRVS